MCYLESLKSRWAGIKAVILLCLFMFSFSAAEAGVPKVRKRVKKRIIEKRVVPLNVEGADTPKVFDVETIELVEWHKKYTPLAKRKSGVRGRRSKSYDSVVETKPVEKDVVSLSVSPHNPKHARVGRWSQLREDVYGDEVALSEVRTPEGKRFQEIVDTVSLRDVGGFDFKKNGGQSRKPEERIGSLP